MIQKIIHRLLRQRHFWRNIGFDELSEIYASQFLRALALNMISVFVPIYLYKLGYSLPSIFTMYIVYFGIRPVFGLIGAKIVAAFGPKHAIAFADVIYIVYLSLLLTVVDLHWPLALIASVGSFAACTFYIAFEVDFSKIKHSEHGGKEIGYEQIFEKIGAVLGPVIGGLIATFIDPRYTIAMAIVVLCGSLVPIFMSAEPTHLRQRIIYKGFPWRRHKWDFISGIGATVENLVTVFIWPIFIAITVLTVNTFAALGALTSAGTAVALISVFAIGKLVDKRRGGLLLKIGAISNAALHLFRPFASSVPYILGVNIVNESATAAYRLPYQKGKYDAADSVTGYRIVYFTISDIFATLTCMTVVFLVWLAMHFYAPINVLKSCFVAGALASLMIMTQKFIALRDN